MRLVKIKGGFSGGTIASVLGVLEAAAGDREMRKVLADPYALNPPGERNGPDGADPLGARFDETIGRWTAPFMMAPINTRVVRRSNALAGYPYGRDFRYDEAVVARSRLQARVFAAGLGLGTLAGLTAPGRWLARRFLPAPGEGPSERQRDEGMFEIRLEGVGDGSPARRVRGRIRGEHDPGYGETSRMLGQSALCLALDDLPSKGGVLTPAVAMGEALLARLRGVGMIWEVGDGEEPRG